MTIPVTIHEDTPARYCETRHVPIGVVAAIAPWNYPLLLAAFKLGPALVTGNCVVLKPSPFTPLTSLKLGELVQTILPPGVLNVISGGDALGPWLTEHPGIDKIAFTGSTATGKRVMASAAETLKRLTLELGGNDPAIVMHMSTRSRWRPSYSGPPSAMPARSASPPSASMSTPPCTTMSATRCATMPWACGWAAGRRPIRRLARSTTVPISCAWSN